ncbi:MAG TPA: LysR family transcriptional regulator [Casimicrobiaceae bacterium]|nr:LysR family transcriptional regulator [Casimicrobiaceae bacterium]
MTTFRRLDLNLLRVLVAVQGTGSVTQAGRQLALSQPAVSHALARLRDHFGDALFVRSRAGLHPTPLAQRIVPAAAAYLRALETAFAEATAFDPATDAVQWRLSMSDLGEMLFLPPLAAALRREAPKARVGNAGVPVHAVGAALEARDVDLAIGILAPAQRDLAGESLFHERYVAVTARDWQAAGSKGDALTARQLAAASLAVASPTATYHESVQRMLDTLGLAERTVVHTRHYAALPELVTSTDLLAIVPQMYARAMAARWPVRVWTLPGEAPQYDVRMVWHATATHEPAHAWLRALVRRLFGREAAVPRRRARPS